MAQQLSTNTFGVAKWVVSHDPTQGTHTTIASSMASASSGDTIWVRDGIYTENVTLTPGVSLSAIPGDQDSGNVTVIGKFTLTGAGTCAISNIKLQTNGDFFLAVTGSAASVAILDTCYLNCSNNTGINYSSSSTSSGIKIVNCLGDVGQAGITLFAGTGAGQLTTFPASCGIYITDSTITSTGNSTTPSNSSDCQVGADHCRFFFPFSVSSSGSSFFVRVNIGTSNQNTTCFTSAGVGDCAFIGCGLTSGSASAISIGAGTEVGFFDGVIDSSNINAVTGPGTFNYMALSFPPGNSSGINATTQLVSPWTVQQGGTFASTFTAFAPVCAGTTPTGSFQSANTGIGTPGFILTSTGAASLPTWQAPVLASTAFTKISRQVFTTSGTYTPTAGMDYCDVQMVGGGGGAGGTAITGIATGAVAGGGGGGEYAQGISSAASIGVSKAVTIGAGGAGASGSSTGTAGGTTSLGSIMTAVGGAGGAGGAAVATLGTSSGGAGGTGGSGGDWRIPGQSGGGGFTQIITSGVSSSGSGGTSFLSPGSSSVVAASAGSSATGYGGGGSGALATINTAALSGGSGSSGIVIITEYATV